jgi:hypothetical protein
VSSCSESNTDQLKQQHYTDEKMRALATTDAGVFRLLQRFEPTASDSIQNKHTVRMFDEIITMLRSQVSKHIHTHLQTATHITLPVEPLITP